MNPELRDAIFQKLAFKPAEMKRYQAAVIYTALALHPSEFAADDVPSELRPESSTTAGCSFAVLKHEGVGLFVRVSRRASKAPGRNCAWINTYRLSSVAIAQTWLRNNGFEAAEMPMEQGELLTAAAQSIAN